MDLYCVVDFMCPGCVVSVAYVELLVAYSGAHATYIGQLLQGCQLLYHFSDWPKAVLPGD